MTNANPASCGCVCVWGGVGGGGGGHTRGLEHSEEGQKSVAVFVCMWFELLFPPCVCLCVHLTSQCLHHSARDPISVPLTKMPIELPTIETKINSFVPT